MIQVQINFDSYFQWHKKRVSLTDTPQAIQHCIYVVVLRVFHCDLCYWAFVARQFASMTGTQVKLPADSLLRLIDAFQNQMLVFSRGLLVSHGSLAD